MRLTRRSLAAGFALTALPARAQHRVLAPEETVELEHEDRVARLREAVDRLGMPFPPRFSVTRVPRERMPANFHVSVPVLRVAFSERTFFDTAQWSILPTGMQAVAAVTAATRGEAPDVAVFVAGHTDNRGGEAYNDNLSIQRANAVSDAMMGFGVGEVALWRVGFGEVAPLYANDTDEHRAFNRRVEFLFGARVEPVVQVLSRVRQEVCVSSTRAETERCIVSLPKRASVEATQVSSRPIGVGLSGRSASVQSRRPSRSAPAPQAVAASIPRTLTIPLLETRAIAAPRR